MSNKPTPEQLLAVIHRHCLDCCGGSKKVVHDCSITGCKLWPYREPEPQKNELRNKNQITIDDLMEETQWR